ncbi:MAG: DUF881 domain-containing protein [Nocardioides sp.]|uniref:DUF881 domain-containing protein n=1 Tax=Nocardioides sp. TaxID=35761 RepID=UPI0039E62953
MTEPASTHGPHAHRARMRRWRLGTPLVVAACGALFVVSALNSQGTDLRPGRYTDLSQLVGSESRQYQRLEEQVKSLNEEVTDLTNQVADTSVRKLRREAEALKDPAGFVEVSGPGVTITMSDAPDDLIEAADADDGNAMVVHQQDIQAVVNALWRGGAKAVTIAGQRVISTTGIKCTGSTVTLQGVPYPEPFVIEAVGGIDDLVASIDGDDYVAAYREDADDPAIQLGWDMTPSAHVVAPAYAGLRDLSYAKPLT